MMFNVKVSCPAALPVQLTIGYLAQGRSATASLPGFPDLASPVRRLPREHARRRQRSFRRRQPLSIPGQRVSSPS